MRETWYILENGENANPVEVAPDAKGVLRHKSGVAVGIRPDGNPKSRGVDIVEQKPVALSGPPTPGPGLEPTEKAAKPPVARQVKSEAGKLTAVAGETREVKAGEDHATYETR